MKKYGFILLVLTVNVLFGASSLPDDLDEPLESLSAFLLKLTVGIATIGFSAAGLLYMIHQEEKGKKAIIATMVGGAISLLSSSLAALFG